MAFLARSVQRSARFSAAYNLQPLRCIHYRLSLASYGDNCFNRSKFQNRHLSSNVRLGRTLYRQLLRWCQDTGSDIPLSSFVPPVTTTPPIVDQAALERLARGEDDFIRSLLPSNAILEERQMTVPLRGRTSQLFPSCVSHECV
jgi:hypothetical protein